MATRIEEGMTGAEVAQIIDNGFDNLEELNQRVEINETALEDIKNMSFVSELMGIGTTKEEVNINYRGMSQGIGFEFQRTIPSASTLNAGVMTAADKTKLDLVVTDGDGMQFLSDDGTYKTIADEEDITAEDGNLKLKDRAYNADNFSGKGYKILRKNIVNGKNVLTQEMINEEDTIYEIRYDYDLNKEQINIPENCVLKFEGGSLNNGIINGNNTKVLNDNFICNCSGTFIDNKNNKYTPFIKNKLISITTQNQFDDIINKINNGEIVNIELNNSSFILKSNVNVINSLIIKGNNTKIYPNNTYYDLSDAIIFTSTHYKCRLKNQISEFSVFVDNNDKLVQVASNSDENINKISYIVDDIITLSNKNIQFKIDDVSNININNVNNIFGCFDAGWILYKFKCNSISGNIINATIINSGVTDYNYDNRYGYKVCKLYNTNILINKIYYDSEYIYIPKNINKLFCIDNETNININGENFDVQINNILFYNFKNVFKINSSLNNNIYIDNIICENITNKAINANKTENNSTIIVKNSKFLNSAILEDVILQFSSNYNNKKCIFVQNCEICNTTNDLLYYKNRSSGVRFYADGEFINNKIYNVCSTHIGNSKGDNIIKNCIIFNTSKFNYFKDYNLARDTGAIYVNHFTRDENIALNNTIHIARINYNKIFNIGGRSDTRGIFIDDGRGDVECIGNIIYNTQSYSIDSRDVPNYNGDTFTLSCIRNKIENNILFSPYKLQYGSGVIEENKFINRINYLATNALSIITDDMNDVKLSFDDYIIESDEHNIIISKEFYNNLPSDLKNILKFSDNTSKCIKNYIDYNDNLANYKFDVFTIDINQFLSGTSIIYNNIIILRTYPIDNNNAKSGNAIINIFLRGSIDNIVPTINIDSTIQDSIFVCGYKIENKKLIIHLGLINYKGELTNTIGSFYILQNNIYYKHSTISPEMSEDMTYFFKINNSNNNIIEFDNDALYSILSKYKFSQRYPINVILNKEKYVFIDKQFYKTQGSFNDKPQFNSNMFYLVNGFTYFCTDRQTSEGTRNGIMIYYVGDDTWVDALGRIVDDSYPQLITGTTE